MDMYLIEDIENDAGMFRIWLRQDRLSYTVDIEAAGRFSKADAIRLEVRDHTKMWSESFAVNQSQRVVVK